MTLRTENLTVSYGTDKVLNGRFTLTANGEDHRPDPVLTVGEIDAVKLFFAAFNAAVWHRISRR